MVMLDISTKLFSLRLDVMRSKAAIHYVKDEVSC